jgi:hypothetical protein
VICACLPYFHPFIIDLLARTIAPETVTFESKSGNRQTSDVESDFTPPSPASMSHLTRKTPEPYCRPLVTWGLDHSSLHRHSRFPSNTAKPIFTPRPPESFFNRLIEVPQSRPQTSTSETDPLSRPPPRLPHVGVLPIIDWDSDSSTSGGSRRSTPVRNPTSEYVFNRQNVISVPEESYLYDDGSKRFAPPITPRMFKAPPRAF